MRILNIRRLALAQQLLVAALAAFLAAGAANAEAMRRPLTISGSPATSVVVGKKYSFTPSASGPSGRTLKFSVSHKPAWTTFSALTGRLVGTPKASNKGTFSNIVIKVSDGVSTASLAPFSITVKAATTTTTPPPTISGTPPTSATVGTPYSFKPTASDTSGATLSFSAQNMPGLGGLQQRNGCNLRNPDLGQCRSRLQYHHLGQRRRHDCIARPLQHYRQGGNDDNAAADDLRDAADQRDRGHCLQFQADG